MLESVPSSDYPFGVCLKSKGHVACSTLGWSASSALLPRPLSGSCLCDSDARWLDVRRVPANFDIRIPVLGGDRGVHGVSQLLGYAPANAGTQTRCLGGGGKLQQVGLAGAQGRVIV